MRIDIWSDIVCPWCAIGKANLDEALRRFEAADPARVGTTEVVWHSFELDPQAPRERAGDYVELLAAKYGAGRDAAQSMIDRMTATGAEAGVTMRFDLVRPGNSFDAHRLVHLGAARGVQNEVKERFLRGYLSEGVTVGDPMALVPLAVEAGLDEDEVRAVLATDAYAGAVRADEETAYDLGVTGVPFFVVDRRLGVPGAQPPDVLLGVLEQAWASRTAALVTPAGLGGGPGDAAACGPDGCAVPGQG